MTISTRSNPYSLTDHTSTFLPVEVKQESARQSQFISGLQFDVDPTCALMIPLAPTSLANMRDITLLVPVQQSEEPDLPQGIKRKREEPKEKDRAVHVASKVKEAVTKTCSECKETKTDKIWYKDPKTGISDRCQACYRKAKKAITKTCSECKETKTDKIWYKDPKTGISDRCQACYQKAIEAITKTCSKCNETKTSKKWYKVPRTDRMDRCQACYQKAIEAITKTCSKCNETKTSKNWYTSPKTGLLDRCIACYRKAWKAHIK